MIKDVHSLSLDQMNDLKWVGIKNHPFQGRINAYEKLHPITGKAKFGVSLKNNSKGVHMSRISEEINSFMGKEINKINLVALSNALSERVESEDIWLNFNLNLILEQTSPVSKKTGFDSINIIVDHFKYGQLHDSKINLNVMGTSLCPASKTNSKFGAHSQRSKAKVTFPFNNDLTKYLELIYNNFSARTYPILKMADEVFVTEGAYSNPKFVEDLTRDLISSLNQNNLPYLDIKFENYESIHNYDVFAIHCS